MNRTRRLLLRLAAVTALVMGVAAPAPAQQVVIRPSVLGAGGATMTGGDGGVAGTAGQPVIGRSDPGAVNGEWGFWHALRTGSVSGIIELAQGGDGDAAMRIVPNPASTSAALAIELARAAWVRIRLIDLMGRVVATIAEGRYESGPQSVEIELGALPSSHYVIELMTNGRRTTGVLVIER
jgi:hypothetical protein